MPQRYVCKNNTTTPAPPPPPPEINSVTFQAAVSSAVTVALAHITTTAQIEAEMEMGKEAPTIETIKGTKGHAHLMTSLTQSKIF